MRDRRDVIILSGLMVILAVAGPVSHAEVRDAAPRETPEATVTAAFSAVLKGDFNAYLKTLHPTERETRTQRDHVKRYQWKRFSGTATRYLQEKRPDSYAVTRKDTEGDHVVLFLQDRTKPERLPVPVRLRKAGSGWGIVMNSL